VTDLEQELATLEAERNRIGSLGLQLQALEEQYGQFRQLFGLRAIDTPSDVWLPPATASRSVVERTAATSTLPDSWPLSERGFVTQGLLDGADGDHPGLDIAVPTDSYVRAAGAGNVLALGDDPVYGRYVLIHHGDGYTTRYGHTSVQLVSVGQGVRQNEVIALSGSSGRSTAPHLHFEILLNGEAVDPLTMVTPP
jgi:murein DD-endopeptidase MepM/ murein hydrolase activator NlpD